jgi:light-regulated signal transduction histidine kinase (bacteriophytochrome)
MINVILFIIGVLFIIISFILIIRDENSENGYYRDIEDKFSELKEYNKTIEEVVDNLEDMIQELDKKVNNYDEENLKTNKVEFKDIYEDTLYNKKKFDKDKTKNLDIKEEIYRLRDSGLDSKEIAKILGRGKREIDIILRMKDDNLG